MEQVDTIFLGGGPAGYNGAFRLKDELPNSKVIIIEERSKLGGVCLNVGCIPSKALLNITEALESLEKLENSGVTISGKPKIDLDKVRQFKNNIINQLANGLSGLAKQRKVPVVLGKAEFIGTHELELTQENGNKVRYQFKQCVIAAGSRPIKLPNLPDDSRIMDSTGALELAEIPKSLLVIGGGIIGMEMAQVYSALGSKITVVELGSQLMPGVDADMLKPLMQKIKSKYEIFLNTKVVGIEAKKNGLHVQFEGEKSNVIRFDRVLVAVGRRPNGDLLNLDQAGVVVDERGFIPIDNKMRTNLPHIYAVGDITSNTPLLAHTAVFEAKLAAEIIANHDYHFDAQCVPNVAYTNPEIAWVGATENELRDKKIDYGVGAFPWQASGRAIAQQTTGGITKLLFDNKSKRLLGAAITGYHAGDMISAMSLAIEMGATAEDIALTIHPHPTTAETMAQAAEAFLGTITEMPKKK